MKEGRRRIRKKAEKQDGSNIERENKKQKEKRQTYLDGGDSSSEKSDLFSIHGNSPAVPTG